MKRLLPYQTVVGDLSLEVREARLDDIALPYEMISTAQRVVALHRIERDEWRSARLSVRVRAPEQELQQGPWTGMECLATLSERRTNTRTATRLRWEGPGEWSGEVELQRDHHLERAELLGQLIATVGDVPGRVIATTEASWTVDLQSRTPTRREEIRTRWVDFGDEDHPQLHPFKNDPWTVEAVGQEPVLYLNSGFEGLKALLASGRAIDRPARDALAAQIATDVWTVLFNAATYQEDGDTPEWPGGWRESVLRRMLPDLFPTHSPDDALAEVVSRHRTGDGADLQTRILHAAGKQARRPRNLGNFMRTLRRTGQEEE
ncbi:hypothetical protein [Streptosporangium pseudovulgare]|uniref:CYTH domain-containing protein n=1 Tax=Streptosporangium pseudovulgare TaxID=35765 RepID=A0ABQ2QS23_9ACTN|nr:hypothetical protein [Streptosporangium pseudovulgare]GGP91108.1 hypothetical protein GCM10010140_21020 [Streptosporangium pseudovulgare]